MTGKATVPHAEPPSAPSVPRETFVLVLPRVLHKAPGLQRLVSTDDAYAEATAQGWCVEPVPVVLVKDGEAATVYTAEAIGVARGQGWTFAEGPGAMTDHPARSAPPAPPDDEDAPAHAPKKPAKAKAHP